MKKYIDYCDNELQVGGVPIDDIVKKYGTPIFIYNRNVLEKKLTALKEALHDEFAIYYSMKANPNQTILKYFISRGCGLEIASGGEFHQALVAGCPPDRILFAGPGKTESELEYTIEKGIGEIHVESLQELERISTISYRKNVRVNIAMRVNPGQEAQGGAMRMGGKSAPFGVDEEILETVLKQILKDKMLFFSGIHLFAGTQILNYKTLIKQYLRALKIAQWVVSITKSPIQTVDFGGGLGIPYFEGEKELDIKNFGKEIIKIISELKTQKEFADTTFIVEPGRYLVGESGIYVTRINTIKESRGKKYLIVDGGMNHHLAASGNLGQIIKKNFPVAIFNRLKDEPEELVDIVGPLCTPLDVLARNIKLPPAEVGDLVGVFQSGAYARTASPLGFLSHLTPAEVLVHDGNVNIIRRRGTYTDFFHDMQ